MARDEIRRARGGEDHAIAGPQAEAREAAGTAGGVGFELAAGDPAAAGVVDLGAVWGGAPMTQPAGRQVGRVAGRRVEGCSLREVIDRTRLR